MHATCHELIAIKSTGCVQVTSGTELHLHHAVSVAQLRRLKRGFLKAATAGTGAASHLRGGTAGERAFAAYLREQLDAAVA
jgi:hypothetical protein